MDYIFHYDSPLGAITVSSDAENITGLWFDGQKHYPAGIEDEYEERDLEIFRTVRRWLDAYFSGRDPGFTPPLDLKGTQFRQKVWQILLTIPYGQTATYGDIAKLIARRGGLDSMSAQAVGGAVGHNPISLIVPCHRVVGADGSLTGYGGGVDKKAKLLYLERTGILI